MSIRFQADNDLNGRIVSATFRREPAIDLQTAQQAQLDPSRRQRAASENRILVSHDKRTMPRHVAAFLKKGHTSPGILLVIPQDAALKSVVETLVLIWADDRPEEWANAITIIPF